MSFLLEPEASRTDRRVQRGLFSSAASDRALKFRRVADPRNASKRLSGATFTAVLFLEEKGQKGLSGLFLCQESACSSRACRSGAPNSCWSSFSCFRARRADAVLARDRRLSELPVR